METINGCTIIKTGADAKNIGICELYWPDQECVGNKPQIRVLMKPASEFAPDLMVTAVVETHKSVLKELDKSVLCPIPEGLTFSSVGIRLRPSSVGTFVCRTLREELGTELCLCGAGSIRGNKNYTGEKFFTYANLKSEIPFDTVIVVLDLPGQVICDMISFTRGFALQKPPVEKGAYLQVCDAVEWCADTNTVAKLAGQAFDPVRMYRVCMNVGMLEGLDNVVPLLAYQKSCPANDKNIHKTAESGIGAKDVIISHFSKVILFNLIKEVGGFAALDTDGDGAISRSEFESGLGGSGKETTSMLIANLFGVADMNGDGTISKAELSELSLSMTKIHFPSNQPNEMMSVDEVVGEVKRLMIHMDEEATVAAIKAIDVDGNGFVTRQEFEGFLSTLQAKTTKNVVI